jgi:hypothetical protein
VSVEKVVATIESPNNHQGIFLPDKKNWDELSPDFLDTIRPMSKVNSKKEMMIIQSRFAIFIGKFYLSKSKKIFHL